VLKTRGIETYLPMWRTPGKTAATRKPAPFFPGYLFAHADLEVVGRWALQYAPGVRTLVCIADEPAWLDASVFTVIEKRMRQMEHQVVDANGARLEPGDPVRILTGPLQGLEAVFDCRLSSSDRVRILVNFIQRYARLDIEPRFVEKKPRTQFPLRTGKRRRAMFFTGQSG
jgi:transcription antitermination factor NusG